MTFGPTGSNQAFTSPFLAVPEDPQEARLYLESIISDLAFAVNVRDIGLYDTTSRVCGQSYFTSGNAVNFRPVYRVVIDFGALPNAGTTTAAHGITLTSTTYFTRIYGTATDPTTGAIPLPYSSPTLNQNISLLVDATNVSITTGIDYSGYTECYVVLEYV